MQIARELVFPREALPLVRCVQDGGALEPSSKASASARCTVCHRSYPIEGRLIRLGLEGLHPESDRERRIRDQEALSGAVTPWSVAYDEMEISATLAALDLAPHHRLLELGPGRGRFTLLVETMCSLVVGIDISLESLRVAASRLQTGKVALAHADVTKAIFAPGAFDRILGTLTSNLPDSVERRKSYQVAARALDNAGKLVFTTHYYGLRARLDREAREGRYIDHGIYRRLLTIREIRTELRPYFRRIRVRPICVILPFSRRLRLPLVATDRVARTLPLLRAFGDLLLVEASHPRR